MRIAIVGAGVSGLSTYLFLAKHLPPPPAPQSAHQFTICEAYSVAPRKKGEGTVEIPLSGVGFGIGANGMNALFELDPTLHDEVLATGFPSTLTTLQSRRGWMLGALRSVWPFQDRLETTVTISRKAVLESFFSRIPDGLVTERKLVKAVDSSSGKAVLHFSDDSAEDFDLVIGADGMRSKTREAVLGSEHAPYYTGVYSIGGFLDSKLLPELPKSKAIAAKTGQMVMTLGGNGFFGYTPSTSRSKPVGKAHLQLKEPVEPGPQGFWWSSFERDDSDTRNLDFDEMRHQLRERHSNWQDPTVQRIIHSPDLHTIAVATWVMPKAPTWVGKSVALVGDAAHALPSTSGQGVSQALLDAQALSLLLAHNLRSHYEAKGISSENQAIATALEQYVEARKPMVENILDTANRMANSKRNMNWIQEMLMFVMLRIICAYSHPLSSETC